MSVPLSRTISRPFGRPALTASSSSQPWQPTESSGSVPSYVLRDAPEDTPHAMHPHAAAYVTAQQGAPTPETPTRTRTLRQMTPDERTAWMALHQLRPAFVAAPPEATTASSSSAPSEAPPAPPGHGRAPSLAATHVGEATPPASPAQNTQFLDAQLTYSTPSALSGRQDDDVFSQTPIARPPRTSSLQAGPASRALAAVTGAGMGPEGVPLAPELEIVISRRGGQDITLRLFAPPAP